MPDKSEVDRLAKVYAGYDERGLGEGRWSPANPGNQAMVAQRRRVLRGMLESGGFFPLRGKKVLEVGCGQGGELGRLPEWGADPSDLCGVDLLPERVAEARSQFPELHFETMNAENLTFPDGAFDLVLLYTLFSSILDAGMARNVAREISRVVKPGGAVVWYDFRYDNPQNRNVRGIERREVEALFPELRAGLRTVTLLPPIGRRLGPATGILYPLLSAIPPLRSHLIGLLVKPKRA